MTRKFGAIVLLIPFSFTREKVFRLKPVLDEHVTLIKDLANSIEVPSHAFTLCYPHSLQRFICVLMGEEAKFWVILIFH